MDEIKRIVKVRLSEEMPTDDIEPILETMERRLDERIGHLSDFLRVLDRDTYGRIRRTYACCVLQRMAEQLPADSPAVPYARRVCDFNELVQGTLPESGLSDDDLVLLFPHPRGRGTLELDLMSEFAYADSLNSLPFWITFSELLSEETVGDTVTTTMGQHVKLNGKVPAKGADSVFEFNVGKLERMAEAIGTAFTKGEMPPDERAVQKVLRIAVLYYVVFREGNGPDHPRDALTNFIEFKKHVESLAGKVRLDEVLPRIAKRLRSGIEVNKRIRADFKRLIQSRKPDGLPLNPERLYLIISRGILNKTTDMENASPIVPPAPYVTSYLKYLKVTRHPGDDLQALIKEDVRLTESLRYLTLPDSEQRMRGMKRDADRRVLGVLFLPRDNEMRYFSVPFGDMTKLIISYDRSQIHGLIPGSDEKDEYLAALAQLIYVLLAYGVLKAVTRMDQGASQYAEKPMMLMLSLFSTTPRFLVLPESGEEVRGFTHDAHKAIEHMVRQHMPTKSQGFKVARSAEWDESVSRLHTPSSRMDVACVHVKKELTEGYRFWNIITGLSSGMDALWELPGEPSMKQVALISVTSRPCDRLGKRSQGDRAVMFGQIHRFEHEMAEGVHFYRHGPVQALCDDMDAVNTFRNPSLLFASIRRLYEQGVRDVVIVTKVPFTRRIRMTTYDNSTYTNPTILRAIHQEMPDMRVYPDDHPHGVSGPRLFSRCHLNDGPDPAGDLSRDPQTWVQSDLVRRDRRADDGGWADHPAPRPEHLRDRRRGKGSHGDRLPGIRLFPRGHLPRGPIGDRVSADRPVSAGNDAVILHTDISSM